LEQPGNYGLPEQALKQDQALALAQEITYRGGRPLCGSGGTGRHTIEIPKICVFSNFHEMNQVVVNATSYRQP
jgi:hypothetical protein